MPGVKGKSGGKRRGAGQPGTYELELTLDGTQEFVMLVAENEVSTVLRIFRHSDTVLFDTNTQELTFEHYH